MGIAGLYCRSNDDRCFVASIAVVVDGTIADELEVRCVEPAAHASTLEELRVAASELLAHHRPSSMVVWQIDPVPGGASRGLRTTASAARAEGVVLAAASALTIDIVMTQGKAIVATTSASKAKEAVEELAGSLPVSTDSMRRAAAAALSQHRG
jgi:hypothetical protein